MTEENEKMYLGAPWCIGRYESFEIDRPKLITLLGHDYVVWRDKTGKLNAIDNVCPHAGANLAKGGYVVDFAGKKCLACPYHGNKVQFFGDGKVVVDGNISKQAIQPVLPLEIVGGLVWTYGLKWEVKNDIQIATTIEPKLPIPDYSRVPYLPEYCEQLELEKLNHIYSRSQSVNCNLAQAIWNIHDGEHFAGTHRDTILSQSVKIDNLIQDEHKISWQLTLYKRQDKAVRRNKMNMLVEKSLMQAFSTFLPSLAIVTADFQGNIIVGIVSMYPQSPDSIQICLDSYTDLNFSWWQRLVRLPQMANLFRDRLIMEDIAIMENLYNNFIQKIALKNDTPAELAMSYLATWTE